MKQPDLGLKVSEVRKEKGLTQEQLAEYCEVTPRTIQRIENGEDFAELAKEYSDDPTSANLGGDMGWFPPEAYGERVYQTLMAMEPGALSEPFQTMGGWHIIELLDTREIDRTEEAIRAEAREKIRMQRAQQEIEKVLRQFRDEAYVEIRLPGQQQTSG